jgi:hypothetical protein
MLDLAAYVVDPVCEIATQTGSVNDSMKANGTAIFSCRRTAIACLLGSIPDLDAKHNPVVTIE